MYANSKTKASDASHGTVCGNCLSDVPCYPCSLYRCLQPSLSPIPKFVTRALRFMQRTVSTVSCIKRRLRFPFECRLEAWFASVVHVLTLSPNLLYVHMSFFSSLANLLALSKLSFPLGCLWFWPCADVSLSLCIVCQCL